MNNIQIFPSYFLKLEKLKMSFILLVVSCALFL